MSHTPGPWKIRPHYMPCFDRTGKRRKGYQVEGPERLGDMECGAFNKADAALMAATPELLEAAELTVLMFKRKSISTAAADWMGDDEHEAWTALSNAIAKASGEESAR